MSAAAPHMERIKCGLYNILNRLDFMDLSALRLLSMPNTLTGYSAKHSHGQFHVTPIGGELISSSGSRTAEEKCYLYVKTY